MADHSKPTTSSTYSNFVSELDSRLDDITLGLDPANVTATNVPTNAIRWSSASNTWQKWNGTTWGNLSSTYALTSITASGSLIVDGNTTLGNASTDTVTVNGYMGVGGAGANTIGLYLTNTISTGNIQYGIAAAPVGNGTNQINGIWAGPATAASSFTAGTVAAIRASNATKGAGSAITNLYGLVVEDQTQGTNNYGITSLVSSGANKWNIYASGTADNYFAGNVGIGTSSPTSLLSVAGNANITGNTTLGDASTDTVTVNGYMSIGGTPTSSLGLIIASTALTGANQYGLFSTITGTSSATSNIGGFISQPKTAAAAFTAARVSGFYADNAVLGAGSTITAQHGIYIADQTRATGTGTDQGNFGLTSIVSSGANKWNIYASGTADNAFAGNVRIGSTVAPGNTLDVTGSATISGRLGFGANANTNVGIYYRSTATVLTGSTTGIGLYMDVPFASDVTSTAAAAYFRVNTAAAAYTTTNAIGLSILDAIKGAGSTITNQYGLNIADQTQGTNNYGIFSAVSSGANKWNIYASGTAANYFAGNVNIGSATGDSTYSKGSNSNFSVASTGTWTTGSFRSYINSANSGGLLVLAKSRGTTVGTLAETLSGDVLGLITSEGVNTSLANRAATGIYFEQDAASGATEVPGRISFRTSNGTAFAERMRLDSAGNLGLGVTPSAWTSTFKTIQLGGGASLSGRLGTASPNDELYLGANAYNDGTNWVYINTAAATQYYQDAGTHVWRYAASGTAGTAITFTQAMTLDASGNLGIGTTAPTTRLQIGDSTVDVNNILKFGKTVSTSQSTLPYISQVSEQSAGVTNDLMIFAGGSGGGRVIVNSNDFVVKTGGGTTPSGTERMRINSSGITQFNSNLVMPYQGAPTSKSGAATLTGAELITGILNTTGTTYTITLPTGTDIENALSWSANNVALDWWVINTASGTITIGANSNTTLGTLTIATGVSAHFRIRRTALNTFTVYRLS